MARERGWWTLSVNVETSEGDLEHIAHCIKQGFTEGEIVPWPDENDFTAIGPPVETMVPDPDEDGRPDQPGWKQRFARQLTDDDYAVIDVAFHIPHGAAEYTLGRLDQHWVCSDPHDVENTSSVDFSLAALVPIPHPADLNQARQMIELFNPSTLHWDGQLLSGGGCSSC